jgi:predicted ester cyclase
MRRPQTAVSIIAWSLGLPLTATQPAHVVSADTRATGTMTVEQTQETLAAYIAALLDGGAYETFFVDDIVVTIVGCERGIKGSDQAKHAIDALHHEKFEAELAIRHVMVGPGQAALEAEFIGVQVDKWAGIPPNGRRVDVPYSVFFELAGGKITALRLYGLAEGLYRQMTTVPKM